MNKSKKMSASLTTVLLSLILLLTTAGRPLALTEHEMRFKIEAYIAAEKADDYETMARLLGKDAEELQQGLEAYTESLKLRFAQTMDLNFTGVSFGEHRILFIRLRCGKPMSASNPTHISEPVAVFSGGMSTPSITSVSTRGAVFPGVRSLSA